MTPRPIALLTDFGLEDPFVGIMKGVIQRLAPECPLIDITHQVPAGDIQRGAITLWQAYPHFPQHTIFLTVIDPGVGTKRKAIYLKANQRIFIGPDNGVFSLVSSDKSPAWELSNPELQYAGTSTTFHGRDIFAPAAAHAALGKDGPSFGPPLDERVQLPEPTLREEDGTVRGEVLTRDQFGNVLTSLGRFSPQSSDTFRFDPWIGSISPRVIPTTPLRVNLPSGKALPLVQTFAAVDPGQCAALVGSTGLIELVANQASAADLLGLQRGDPVTLAY